MKVLIIEDDTQLNIAVSRYFQKNSFNTVSVKCGLEAIEYIDGDRFDLFVVDINVPNISGLDIVSHIRKTDLKTPVIVITASLEIENLTQAFENGCSEYIKKPFHLKELDVRVSRLLNSSKNSENIYFSDEFYFSKSNNQFYNKSIPITLRYKEKKFCELLIENIGTIVSNEIIYEYVWDDDRDSYPLRQLVNGLRKKLPYDIIQTKIKEGYVIEVKK